MVINIDENYRAESSEYLDSDEYNFMTLPYNAVVYIFVEIF